MFEKLFLRARGNIVIVFEIFEIHSSMIGFWIDLQLFNFSCLGNMLDNTHNSENLITSRSLSWLLFSF